MGQKQAELYCYQRAFVEQSFVHRAYDTRGKYLAFVYRRHSGADNRCTLLAGAVQKAN